MKKIFLIFVSYALLIAIEMVPALASELDEYRLVGTISGKPQYTAAVVYDPGAKNIKIIKIGEKLIGYELIRVEREEAFFQMENIIFKMRLKGAGGYRADYRNKVVSYKQDQRAEPKEATREKPIQMTESIYREPSAEIRYLDEDIDEDIKEQVHVSQIDERSYMVKNPNKDPLFGSIYTTSFPPKAQFERLDWMSGYRLHQVDQRSLFYQAGFQEGDLIIGANGKKWNSPGREDDIQLLFKGENSLTVDVYREGEFLTFNYMLE